MGTLGQWIVFGAMLAVMLAIDLFAHRGAHGRSRRAAVIWAIVWISVGLAFAGLVAWRMGAGLAREYLAAYLIEKSLSLDNMFVFVVIFGALGVPHEQEHRVLVWGILGALVTRGLFIFLGVAAISRWAFLEIGLGVLLLIVAVHVLRENPAAPGRKSRVVDWLERHVPFTKDAKEGRFVVRREGRLHATPLLVALLAIELSDVMFAIDSIPAAFAVTRNEFVLYTSNAFAILGLRSLYVAVSTSLTRLSKLHYGLAVVLAFAGLELILARWVRLDPLWSVGVIVVALTLSIVASLRSEKSGEESRGEATAAGTA